MSLHDLIEDTDPSNDQLLAETINKINTILRKNQTPDIQQDTKILPAGQWEETHVYDTVGPKPVLPLGGADKNEYVDSKDLMCYIRTVPQIPIPCPLTETLTDTGIQFSTGILGASPADFPKKFGGGAKPNGSYITITDHAILNPSDKISIPMYVYIPATSSGDERQYYIDKGQYRIFIEKHDIAANTIKAIVSVGGTEHTISYQFTPNQWHHVVISIKSPNFKMYFNKTLVASSTALVGNIDTTNNPLRLFNRAYGVRLLESGGKRLLENGGLRKLE